MLVNGRANCQFALLPANSHQGKPRKLTVSATFPHRSLLAIRLDNEKIFLTAIESKRRHALYEHPVASLASAKV